MPPNERISDLGAAAPLVLTDHVLVARGATAPNFKATIQAVLALGGAVGGGGTVDKIPIWVSPGVLGNSIISQDITNSNITVAGDLFAVDSQPGATVSSQAFNSSDTAGSNAQLIVNVAGTSAGDPFIQWRVDGGASNFVMGIDNSEDDKLVGSVGGVLGVGNWLEVTTARGITLDAASGQTVALAVSATEELQVSGTAVTIPTNDLVITVGKVGIQTATPDTLLSVGGNSVTTILSVSASNEGIEVVPGVLRGRVLIEGSGQGELILVDSGGTSNRRASGLRSADDRTTFAAYNDGGGVINDNIIVMDHDTGAVGIGVIPTLPLDVNAKAGITSIGGYAIKLTNKLGRPTAPGELVIASTSAADAFVLADASDDRVIGIILEGGVGNNSEAWIVVAGFAMVLMDTGGASFGDRIVSSTTAGSGLVDNGPIPAVHFQEIGHSVGTIPGAGLVKCSIHLN